jgi:hypothetical protein
MLTRACTAVVCALVLAACGSDGGGGGSPSEPGASGVSAAEATATVEALCELAAQTDPAEAEAWFFDRAHASLHEIAAAAARADPGSDTDLLVAKRRVEDDLQRTSLPASFGDDVEALRAATAEALDTLVIDAPACAT